MITKNQNKRQVKTKNLDDSRLECLLIHAHKTTVLEDKCHCFKHCFASNNRKIIEQGPIVLATG